MSILSNLLIIVILTFFRIENGHAENWEGKLIESSAPVAEVNGFHWDTTKLLPLETVLDNQGKWVQTKTKVKGNLRDKNLGLLISSQLIKRDSNENFEYELILTGEKTPIEALVVNSYGEVDVYQGEVVVSDWERYQEFLKTPAENQNETGKRLELTAGIGALFLNYSQTNVLTTTETTLLGTISVSRSLSPSSPYDFGASTSLTFLPLLSNGDPSLVKKIQIFDLNARVGRDIPVMSLPWKLRLNAGYYYNTMLGSGALPGYKNANGLYLSPTLSFTLKNGHSISAYFKYCSFISSEKIFSLENRQFIFGTSYVARLKGSKFLVGGLDYSSLNLIASGQLIRMSGLLFTLGFGF